MTVLDLLDHGRVAERGTHDELIGARGAYYRLWQAGHCSDLGRADTGRSP